MKPLNSFSEYQNVFSKMSPKELGEYLMEGINMDGQKSFRYFPLDFYSAGIDRLFEFSSFNNELTDEEKKTCNDFAEHIINVARAKCSGNEEILDRFNKAIEYARNYYKTLGDFKSLEIKE